MAIHLGAGDVGVGLAVVAFVLDGHEKTVAGLAVHPTREIVASASYDITIQVWEFGGLEELVTLSGTQRLLSLTESLD